MSLPPETEAALTAWRDRLRRAGITVGSTLDELESHVRERIFTRVDQGLNPQAAFEEAVMALGSPHHLKEEFARVGTDRRFTHAQATWVGLSASVLLILWWSLAFFDLPHSWMSRVHKSSLPYSFMAFPFALVWTSFHATACSTQVDPAGQRFSWWNLTSLRFSLFFIGLVAVGWWGAVQDWIISLLVTYLLLAIVVSQAAAVGGFWFYTRRRVRADWVGVIVIIGILLTALWTSWPMRVVFHFSHEQLDSLALRVEAGEAIKVPVWAGGVRVTRVEKRNADWAWGTCLWVVPREGGPTGFIRRGDGSPREPGNNINRRIQLSDRWYFVSED